jgi:hypothetical protein
MNGREVSLREKRAIRSASQGEAKEEMKAYVVTQRNKHIFFEKKKGKNGDDGEGEGE